MIRVSPLPLQITAGGVLAAGAAPAADKPFPETIPLPKGFQPEGSRSGRAPRSTSVRRERRAHRGNLRTGTGVVSVQGGAGRSLTGIESTTAAACSSQAQEPARPMLQREDRSGGPPGVHPCERADIHQRRRRHAHCRVLHGFAEGRASTGSRSAQGARSVMRRRSCSPATSRCSRASTSTGLDATANGKIRIAVQSNTGNLFRIDPATGATRLISLGSESVPNGDGILLNGKTLYVVQNQNNRRGDRPHIQPGFGAGRHAAVDPDSPFRHDRRLRTSAVRRQCALRRADPRDDRLPGRAAAEAEGRLSPAKR